MRCIIICFNHVAVDMQEKLLSEVSVVSASLRKMENQHFREFSLEEKKIILEILLDEDQLAEGQLGAKKRPTKNRTPEHEYSPRQLVTEKESLNRHYYLQVKCRRPVFGTFKSPETQKEGPACLIIFTAAFLSFGSRNIETAKITISFEDGVIASLDANSGADLEAMEEALAFQPEVLDFEPRHWWGLEEILTSDANLKGKVKLPTFSSGPGSSLSFRRTEPILQKGRSSIHGVIVGENSSEVKLSLGQNPVTHSGIVPEFSIPIVISYTPGRAFAARIQVSAKSGMPFGSISTGKLDDPLKIDPDKLVEGNDDTRKLNEGDMKVLCNLDKYKGGFTEI